MFPIPYCFVWSPDYEDFATILKRGIAEYSSIFTLHDTFISQEEYNQTLSNQERHFLCGSFLKLEKTRELLYTLPEDSYFIFSDADVALLPKTHLEKLLRYYMEVEADIVFMREAPQMNYYNIGFSLIRVNDRNRQLFQTILQKAEETPTELDQVLVNQALSEYTGSVFSFPHEFVMTSCSAIDAQKVSNYETMCKHIYVYQPLCDPTKPKEHRRADKLGQYKVLGISVETKI